VPGYEPFLLCDFHVHTTWSDGRMSLRDVVDLYGQTGRFDVIAITDHILMERDLFKRAGRLMSLGRKHFSVTQDRFDDYLAEIAFEARRARRMYDLLVIPGAEIHPEPLPKPKELAHHRAEHQGVDQRRSAGARDPRGDPAAGCVQHRVPSAPPHHAPD
jgi:hypothetical protein